MGKKVEFTIRAKMDERWVDHFCSMLKCMRDFGALGHSGVIGFYADGDGDFRPQFDIYYDFKEVEGHRKEDCKTMYPPEVLFDAG